MVEAVDSVVIKEQEMPLRGRCEHRPCQDGVERGPVPPVAPDDFTVMIGAVMAGETMRGLEWEMEALGGPREATAVMMAVLQWVEDVFVRCREIQRDAGRLRGAVMAVGAAWVGER